MLNPQQTAAVKHIDGPLLVLAGAGSGKTRVITEKIAHLIENRGYLPNTIYAVTFTNKAANEMRVRVVNSLTHQSRRGLKIATFHTLGLSILKRHLALCGLKKGFSIFDSEDCLQLLRGFLTKNKAVEREYLMQVQRSISKIKNGLLNFNESLLTSTSGDLNYQDRNAKDFCVSEIMDIYPSYQQALKTYNAVDFDDLICLPVRLLENNHEVSSFWQNKVRYLLVDEYQDSNISQYKLVKLLVGLNSNFTVVGDDDQSIYAWRGAKPENLAQLQIDYPQLKIIKLEQNYRSTNRILHAANHLIANNAHLFDKKLWSKLGEGELLRVLCCRDENDEAELVVTDLISHKLRNGKQYSDYAVLYRGNYQARIFEKILRNQGISYSISGGQSWFAHTEIKDIFAYLKLLCNEDDNAAFLRVINTPKRGIGDISLEALANYSEKRGQGLYTCADNLALSAIIGDKPRKSLCFFKESMENIKASLKTEKNKKEILHAMITDIGYEEYIYEVSDNLAKAQKRMGNVWELLDWVVRLLEKNEERDLADVVNNLMLVDILEQEKESNINTLQLMTLHASKGLEFPYVYLVGMEENLLPHRVSIEEDKIEEERRLAYVGITRAQKELCITLAKQRKILGELQDCQPSRFLDELPENSLEWFGRDGDNNPERSKSLAKSHLAGLKNLLE